jgi:hypothetical protein
MISTTIFITKAGEQPGEKDEGNEGGQQQQQGQSYRQKEYCIVLAERIPCHRVHVFIFGYRTPYNLQSS